MSGPDGIEVADVDGWIYARGHVLFVDGIPRVIVGGEELAGRIAALLAEHGVIATPDHPGEIAAPWPSPDPTTAHHLTPPRSNP